MAAPTRPLADPPKTPARPVGAWTTWRAPATVAAAANNVVPSRSLFDGHPANGGNRAAAAPLRMTEQRPGISWDARKRVFRLRGKDSLYVFRVDDSKNLEHLYWGPPLLVEDDLTYLSKTNVPAPFDPKGVVSVARKMGLDELGEIADEHDLSERWKVYTRAKDTATENDSRPRRLENASWRLWSMERHRGGDLNKDLSDGVLAMALGEPVEGDATVATPTVGADADGADGEEAASSAGAARRLRWTKRSPRRCPAVRPLAPPRPRRRRGARRRRFPRAWALVARRASPRALDRRPPLGPPPPPPLAAPLPA